MVGKDRRVIGSQAGFSLLELMVVIFVILLLTGLAVPQYRMVRAKEHLRQCASAFRAVERAQTLYLREFGNYATTLANLENRSHPNSGENISFIRSSHIANASDKRAPCRTVTVTAGANISTGWMAVATPKDLYGADGCQLIYDAIDHRVGMNVANCASYNVNDLKNIAIRDVQ